MFSAHLGIYLLTTSLIVIHVNAGRIHKLFHSKVRPASTQAVTDSDILFYKNENDGTGNYKFSFETADNTRREETGRLVNAGQPDQYIRVDGSFSYVWPDGRERTVYYAADKDGYRVIPGPDDPNSSSFAVVPPAVLASLAG